MPTTEITTNGRNIGEITASVRIHMRNMVNNAIELGMDLIDAKEICGHGEWLPWLKEIGLSVPAVTDILLDLNALGHDLDTSLYTPQDAAEEILKAKKGSK